MPIEQQGNVGQKLALLEAQRSWTAGCQPWFFFFSLSLFRETNKLHQVTWNQFLKNFLNERGKRKNLCFSQSSSILDWSRTACCIFWNYELATRLVPQAAAWLVGCASKGRREFVFDMSVFPRATRVILSFLLLRILSSRSSGRFEGGWHHSSFPDSSSLTVLLVYIIYM